MKRNPKTFISYSHDSEELKRIILAFANQLRQQGINCNLDQYEESPENGWISWMEAEIRSSDYVLVVCTEGYTAKLQPGTKSPQGKGVKWEGAIITQELYESEGRNRKFIPVLLHEDDKPYIPRPLKSYTYYILTDTGYEKLYRRLTKQIAIEKPPVGGILEFPRTGKNISNQASTPNLQPKSLSQNIVGNNNIQIGELSMRAGATVRIALLPAPGTIGANHLLKQAMMDRFNKLGEEREKRFGKSAYPVMYSLFKRAFGIKKKRSWTDIWNWPEAAADEITKYLDEKFANTIAGRVESAAQKGRRIPSKGDLFRREKELLAQLDLEISSPKVTNALVKYFGVNSHTKLDSLKHWHWVMYLEELVRQAIGERPSRF